MKKAMKQLGQFLLAMLIVQVLVVVSAIAVGAITGWHDVPLPTHEQDNAIAQAFGLMIWTALWIGAWLGKKWEWLP